MSVRIDAATAEDADAIVEMWLSLAEGQRSYGSHLRAEDNREQIRDTIARHIVLDGLRVARLKDEHAETSDAQAESADARTESSDAQAKSSDSPSAEQDLVGFVMFGLEAGTYVQDVSRGVVRNLYVRPAYRGDGIGAALLATAETALEETGADVATLEAMAANDRARSFYEEHGYTPHRIKVEKPLGAADESERTTAENERSIDENDTHTRED